MLAVRISVITVAYNRASTIADTLKSVAAQTYPDVEHIVVDGASMDGTLEVIKQHGQHVARVISEADHGIYDAMNKGVKASTGAIIGFLNADDYYAHDHVLEKVAHAITRESLDAVFGDVAFFKPEQPQQLVRRYSSRHFRPDRVSWGWMPAHLGLFVGREVFDRVGPFRTDYRIAGDFEWVARAFRPGALRYRYLSEILVHMCTGGISTGGWRNTLMLNREVMRACRENGISTNWVKLLSKYPFKLLEYLWP